MVLHQDGPTGTESDTGQRWRDGDRQWLGALLAGLSAVLMIALVVLLVLRVT